MTRTAFRITLLVALSSLLLACAGPGATRHEPKRSAFESEPEGASVFVDGGFVGSTPTSFFLPAKDVVEVRVTYPGYLPMEEELHRGKVPEEAGEGVGWEPSYYYPLKPKR